MTLRILALQNFALLVLRLSILSSWMQKTKRLNLGELSRHSSWPVWQVYKSTLKLIRVYFLFQMNERGRTGLVVMGDDSWLRGRGFESRCCIHNSIVDWMLGRSSCSSPSIKEFHGYVVKIDDTFVIGLWKEWEKTKSEPGWRKFHWL